MVFKTKSVNYFSIPQNNSLNVNKICNAACYKVQRAMLQL